MKKLLLAASLALLSACSSLPESVRGPFAHAGRGATASDASDTVSAVGAYPAVTDQGKF